MTIIISHGFKFHVDCGGFGNEETDKEAGISAIEACLDHMDERTVSAIHFADVSWQARDCAGTRPSLIEEVENAGHSAATSGWHNPDAAWISVSAAQ